MLTKRLIEVQSANNGQQSTRFWDVAYSYNQTSEKLLDSMTYPDTKDATGTTVHSGYTVSYTYDLMGRQTGLSSSNGEAFPHPGISGATYNAANQLVTIPGVYNGLPSFNQARTYNLLNQLTAITYGSTASGFKYNYIDGQNNGQIQSMVDYTADTNGQTINYGYDSLKRLATASSPAWSQAYTYDGFGNLTAKTGSSPQTLPVDPTTNRLGQTQNPFVGFCYDKYGRMTSNNGTCQQLYSYDVANRLQGSGTSPTSDVYMYDAHNQRVAILRSDGTEQFFFYDPSGKKLATLNYTGPANVVENVYFAGQLWQQGLSQDTDSNVVRVDRLGSVRGSNFIAAHSGTPPSTYLPFGEDLNSTANDREKFATYTRDNSTGFDFANQRYYSSAYGRFLTADPYRASAGPEDPRSWNKYSYTRNDPANRNDGAGLADWSVTVTSDGGNEDNCELTKVGCTGGGIGGNGRGGGGGGIDDGHGGGGSSNPADSKTLPYGKSNQSNNQKISSASQAKAVLQNEIDNRKFSPPAGCKNLLRVSLFGTHVCTRQFQSSLIPGAYSGTFSSSVGSNLAVTLTANGVYTPNIDLGVNFFNSIPGRQGLTLLHELLHVGLQGDDAAINRAFGITAFFASQT